MKKLYCAAFCTFALLMKQQTAFAQAPVINAATPLATTVEQWGKFELSLDITASWVNPYDYDEIRVVCTFTAPDGSATEVDGFFMQEYTLTSDQTGSISPLGSGRFKVRFSPDQPGAWKYALSCSNASGTGSFPEQTFTAAAPAGGNKGFVRSGQTNYLRFDDGGQFIPVGENIGWYNGNAYVDYKNWLGDLSDNGGNFFRIWQCHWGLGLEWKNNVSGYAGLRRYKQQSAFYTDWLFDHCAEKGIYVMYCLQHHGQVSNFVNPNWFESPYNAANGGPCSNTWDFFTNSTAKDLTKNRFRYVVARWGYSRSIMAWELFNEVDWTDQFEGNKANVAAWHDEMAAFLTDIDPNKHLVSTSYAQSFYDPQVWNHPLIAFTQTHVYVESPNLERVLSNHVRKHLDDFGKPTITGEFGLITSGSGLPSLDPNGIYLHNSLWGSLFSGGMGAGATWWWDNYVAPQNLYYHFAPVASVVQQIPFDQQNLMPASASVSGVPADLVLSPSLGWAALADTSFTIDAGGAVTPALGALSEFLYGAQWNTQYRRPPVFHITNPAGGKFRVTTGGQTGQSPKIAIWLDGVKKLEQNAQINQVYQIDVPAGQHTIKVDNTGTDWISILQYTFEGLGSAMDAYVLKSPDNRKMAGWLLHNRYNHVYVNTNGIPASASGAVLHVPDVENGMFTARLFDCLSGALLSSEAVAVTDGTLSLPLPDVLWDVAFYIDDLPLTADELNEAPVFQYFPNPAAAGAELTLAIEEPASLIAASLLDMEGRLLHTLYEGMPYPGNITTLPLPLHLPAGLYWIKIETNNGRASAKPLVIAGTP
ncbi:MAG: DUF5060 domain-containing protein [Saprospiraceae bacterium]|nr:DUF5060 domain-containing protein [Saprospiraceae bacterium]